MGTVYLAVRSDDVFQKRVAIKILDRGENGAIQGTDVETLESARKELGVVRAQLRRAAE